MGSVPANAWVNAIESWCGLSILLIRDNYLFCREKFIALRQMNNIRPAWKIAPIESKYLSIDTFYFYGNVFYHR